MLGSSKKKLLVSGCSFTASGEYSHFPSNLDLKVNSKAFKEFLKDFDSNFKKWPEIVAEQLDLELVNEARCGKSIESISESIMEYILKNGHDDIEMVLVGWTEFNRFLFESTVWDTTKQGYQMNITPFRTNDTRWFYEEISDWRNFQEKFKIVKIEQDIKTIFILQDFLEKRNIEYKFFFLISPEVKSYYSRQQFSERIIRNTFFQNINGENFHGWPIFSQLGGGFAFDFSPENIIAPGIDGHPNEKGHKVISKNVLKFI